MEDKKKKYEAPKVLRLDDRQLGRGECLTPGNSASIFCEGDGSSTGGTCQLNGGFAGGSCSTGTNVV